MADRIWNKPGWFCWWPWCSYLGFYSPCSSTANAPNASLLPGGQNCSHSRSLGLEVIRRSPQLLTERFPSLWTEVEDVVWQWIEFLPVPDLISLQAESLMCHGPRGLYHI